MTCDGPPATSILFRRPRAEKPSDFPSGDQNGVDAPSVSGRTLAFSESSGCNQSGGSPANHATKTTTRPSHEIPAQPPTTKYPNAVSPQCRMQNPVAG